MQGGIMGSKTLDIIIPTKNNSKILIKNLNYLLNISDRIRVVVLDSSDQPSIFSKNFKNLKSDLEVFRTPKNFSSVQNFDAGVEHIRSDFFIFLCDDDFVSANIMDIIDDLDSRGLKACISTFPMNILWRGFKAKTLNIKNEIALVERKYSQDEVVLFSDAEIENCIRKQSRGPLNLPRAYLGITSSEVLVSLRKKQQNLFGSISPDIFSSIKIAENIESYIKIDYPFIIPGASPNTASAEEAKGSEQNHMKRAKNYNWNSLIPEIHNEACIWSQALSDALLESDRSISNYSNLYSRMFHIFHQHPHKISKAFLQNRDKITLFLYSFMNAIKLLTTKIFERFVNNDVSRITDLKHLEGVNGILEKYRTKSN